MARRKKSSAVMGMPNPDGLIYLASE
jgi:hypothetical protein